MLTNGVTRSDFSGADRFVLHQKGVNVHAASSVALCNDLGCEGRALKGGAS
jgi:hypothetical protein